MFEDLNTPSESVPQRDSVFVPVNGSPGASAPGSLGNGEQASNVENIASPEEEDEALIDWKDSLRRDFEAWLDSVDEIPELDAFDLEEVRTPDLYSFYEQLTAASAESRKANRRTAEAFSQWGDILTRFEAELKPLRETILEYKASAPRENRLSNAHCLVLIDLVDRMLRLKAAFQKTPQKSWWGNDAAWRQAWDTQHQGFGILLSHLEDWLKKEGVERIAVEGKLFDPSIMSAVSADEDPQRPHHTVIEVIAAGYFRQGELLRAAQVKVTLNKTQA